MYIHEWAFENCLILLFSSFMETINIGFALGPVPGSKILFKVGMNMLCLFANEFAQVL